MKPYRRLLQVIKTLNRCHVAIGWQGLSARGLLGVLALIALVGLLLLLQKCVPEAAVAPEPPKRHSATVATLPRSFTIYFAHDSVHMDRRARSILKEVVANARILGPRKIVVAGHADRSGPLTYNEMLSKRRAANVANALSYNGVPAELLEVQAHGESELAVPTEDAARHPFNRRVNIIFLGTLRQPRWELGGIQNEGPDGT